MQDEINEKTVALYIKTGKLTAEVLQKAIKKLLSQAKKELDRQAIPHGKQTLKQLIREKELIYRNVKKGAKLIQHLQTWVLPLIFYGNKVTGS
jgi:hypothetical protein